MINIWNTTFLVGPFAGPAIAGYLGTVINWRGAFGVLAGLYGLSTVLVILLGRETYYVTHRIVSSAPTIIERSLGQGGALAVERPNLAATSLTLLKFIFKVPLLLVGKTKCHSQLKELTDHSRHIYHDQLYLANWYHRHSRLIHPRSSLLDGRHFCI